MTRYDDRRATDAGLDRRQFLAGMAAASLAAMAAGEPRAVLADEAGEPIRHPKPTADCCILLWMGGGMAAPETFDPKAYAPFEVGLRADDEKSGLKVAAQLPAAEKAVGIFAAASAAGDRGGVVHGEVAARINRGAEIGSA